jgi:hypothetical protein
VGSNAGAPDRANPNRPEHVGTDHPEDRSLAVANVRQHVIDALTPGQVDQLTAITEAILQRLDPDGTTAR